MPKSSAIDPYLGYYEAVSCHWSSTGRKGLKYYGLKREGVRRDVFEASHLVLGTSQYLQAPQEGHSHMQTLMSDSPSHPHIAHTYIHIGKGMPSEPTDRSSDSTGEIDFFLSVFFFPFFSQGGAGQVFNLTL